MCRARGRYCRQDPAKCCAPGVLRWGNESAKDWFPWNTQREHFPPWQPRRGCRQCPELSLHFMRTNQ
ncbi:unnamed protein product [Penicillium nalgiovense]|uniref:Uncharacterized protein n=2 Tax=Penicillium TaxID=5073 RepID=A0A9W4MPU0_PENNA|nr:unnamed protein product [Penicillium nalgiovense]CDM32615.1 unnamed protein product [Penicillium roqueforti FM164]CAG8004661.1 unnamed protein product [Penicillium nalgiovense]CAG8008545.1 unnamed protein product [Penicillium nalgiovense]CAG8032331.1 unnamed protein product [Penicillium nalgiovense]